MKLLKLCLFGFVLAVAFPLSAQEQEVALPEGLRDKAVIVRVLARINNPGQENAWSSEASKTTIPGQPVYLKTVGTNVVIAAQFTPHLSETGYTLVAQTQVWVMVEGQGIQYLSSLQTVTLKLREKAYFFPLGAGADGEAPRLVLEIELLPYKAPEPDGQR